MQQHKASLREAVDETVSSLQPPWASATDGCIKQALFEALVLRRGGDL